ncbi:MAG: S41 family peptidase [Patescibacteria group bacterium]|jgi:hypothetical protein
MRLKKLLPLILVMFLVLGIGGAAGYFLGNKNKATDVQPEIAGVSQNKYALFLDEVYQTIKENHWNKMEEPDLLNFFILGAEKLTGQPLNLTEVNKVTWNKALLDILDQYDSDEKRKEFSATLADVVLSNLEPFGRSRLYTQKEEKELSDNVTNRSGQDRYEALGVDKQASQSAIDKAFNEKSAEWDPETNDDPEAAEKFAQIQEAYKVLKDEEARKVYDISGIEPTMDYKLVNNSTYYVHLTKFSPTTFEELNRVMGKLGDRTGVENLIFDLRNNIGGAIDQLPYFLGPFIGMDQYAYQFFHQGEKVDFKTKVGWMESMVRFKKVVILINENSQSTAELMAATLKKYNVGVLVGTKSKGWGTVERVFPLKQQIADDEKHSMFLVHSLTLREDGQPIEGKGVDPVIDIRSKSWEQELYAYYSSNELIEAVRGVIAD